MHTIKWGILSTGNITRPFLEDIKNVETAEVLAVASRSLSKARGYAIEHQIKNWYGSYIELMQDEAIDCIYIATPHHIHHKLIEECLHHGKHVLCEKPITINESQLIHLIDLAKEKDLFLMEALWTYYLPVIKQAKQWIHDGYIGKVRFIRAEFGFNTHYDPENRLFNPELAGGALLDIGVYPIALSNFIIADDVAEIKAVGTKAPTGVDNQLSVNLKYNSGIIAQLSCSFEATFRDDAYIYGTEGFIHIPDFWKANVASIASKYKKETITDNRSTNGYNFEVQHVCDLLLSTKKAENELVLSLRNLQVMDTIRNQLGINYPFE